MSKKNFTGGLNSLLGDQPEKPKNGKNYIEDEKVFLDLSDEDRAKRETLKTKVGRPKSVFKPITKSSQEGTKENETRATFIVDEALLDKLKAIAYWDRVLIKEVINSALQDAVAKYEKKNGSIKPIPRK